MNRKHTHKMLVLIAVAGLAAGAEDPPFNPRLAWLGSFSYSAPEWDVNADGAQGFIGLDNLAGGLLYRPHNIQSGNSVRHQLIPVFTVEDGQAEMRYRVKVSDADKIGFIIGLHSTSTDPFDTTPEQLAAFTKAASSTQVKCKVANATEADEVNGPTIASNTEYDLVVRVTHNPVGDNKVHFFWRTAPSGAWSDHEFTDKTPIDTADLRLSTAVETIDTVFVQSLTLTLFEFEADK